MAKKNKQLKIEVEESQIISEDFKALPEDPRILIYRNGAIFKNGLPVKLFGEKSGTSLDGTRLWKSFYFNARWLDNSHHSSARKIGFLSKYKQLFNTVFSGTLVTHFGTYDRNTNKVNSISYNIRVENGKIIQ